MARSTKAGKSKAGVSKRPPNSRATITFDYVKSNYFRVATVDGIVGGLTPNGGIHMAVWSQRLPYPRQVVHEVSEVGLLGIEVERTKRPTDVIREIEIGLVFSPEMARAMVRWLERQILEEAATHGGSDDAAVEETEDEDGERDNELGENADS